MKNNFFLPILFVTLLFSCQKDVSENGLPQDEKYKSISLEQAIEMKRNEIRGIPVILP